MKRIEHIIEEEQEFKKAKMVSNGNSALENHLEAPTLSRNEEAVDANGANREVPLIDSEETKDLSVSSTDGRFDGEVLLLAMGESKDMSVGSNEAKVKEVSVLEAEERKGFSTVSGDRNVAIESEDRKDVNVKEVPVVEFEEKKDLSAVSGDADTKEVTVLELEEKKDVSSASVDANVKETPTTVSEEKKDSCIATARLEEETGLRSLAIGSSASILRKKLLVLDLNGLLAAVVSPPPKDYVADINIARKALFKRPFCDDFLKFCFEKFEVGIWSSRMQRNVDRITNFLLGDMKSKLLFCWDMSYCAKTTVGTPENKYKYVVFKELKRLWEKHDPNLPWRKGDYNETNTVLLDDSPYKALLNPPYTAIFPHSYSYQNRTDNSLGDGGDLRLHLEKLAEADNVQEFIKMNPFGQEPVTETSESWEFYSQIIHMNLHQASGSAF